MGSFALSIPCFVIDGLCFRLLLPIRGQPAAPPPLTSSSANAPAGDDDDADGGGLIGMSLSSVSTTVCASSMMR